MIAFKSRYRALLSTSFAALLATSLQLGGSSHQAWAFDIDTVNTAEPGWQAKPKNVSGFDAAILRAQVLLDREGFSPGEIDGRPGENVARAIAAFGSARALEASGELTPELWSALTGTSEEKALVEYTITPEDVKGPFLDKVPARMEDMRGLDRLAYGSVAEALAEKFHMSERLLKHLNRDASFKAGERIVVANVGSGRRPAKASKVVVDKSERVVRAFAKSGELLAVLPASVGSAEKPAPIGTFKVTKVTSNPTYRYDPDYAFKEVKAARPFVIKPGPNNPVGSVWIGLSARSYGIHGTPNPAQVGKAESHGCVRLTNWDAKRLAAMVGKGTTVEFVGTEGRRTKAKGARRS